jgi:hypothetical protein
LIGMGDPAKLPDVKPDTYRFTTHRDHLVHRCGDRTERKSCW